MGVTGENAAADLENCKPSFHTPDPLASSCFSLLACSFCPRRHSCGPAAFQVFKTDGHINYRHFYVVERMQLLFQGIWTWYTQFYWHPWNPFWDFDCPKTWHAMR